MSGGSIPPDTVIGQKYRIGRKIGSGSFGEIYSGSLLHQDVAQQVAIKFEKKSARCPQLRHEFKVYRELQGGKGIGKVLYYGSFRDCNVMVMELLGPSLEDVFNKCGRKFTLRTTLKLADELLERVEVLHENHLIHRDIKPANFVLGLADQAVVFCIDFGLSKRYRHPHTLQHIPYREGRSLTGTPRYASVANHRGIETSRRDDLESIGYILVYFLLGKLPWQGLKLPPNVNGTASQKHQLILDKKQLTALPDLCRGCPREFQEYLQYCRELQFDAKPDMAYVRGIFRQLYKKHGFEDGAPWDWDPTPTHAPSSDRPQPLAVASSSSKSPRNAAPGSSSQERRRSGDATPLARPTTSDAVAGPRTLSSGVDKLTINMPSSQPVPTTTSIRQAGSFHSMVGAGITSSRPWTAATETGGQSSSQATVPIPRTGTPQQAHPSRQQEEPRHESDVVSKHRAISSRDQVVISVKAAAYDDSPTARPSTAPGRGKRDDESRRESRTSSGGQAWGDLQHSSPRRSTSRAGRPSPRDDVGESSFLQGLADSDYCLSGAAVSQQRSGHFGGAPLSLVRHRRAEKDRTHQPRPQSGNAAYYAQYVSTRDGSQRQSESSNRSAHADKYYWGHAQPSRHSAWNLGARQPRGPTKAPTRPASAVRSSHLRANKTSVSPTRTRHMY